MLKLGDLHSNSEASQPVKEWPKKIRWTTHSIIDRTNIYQYWLERNQSNIYPEKLVQLFDKSAELISNFPNIGRLYVLMGNIRRGYL